MYYDRPIAFPQNLENYITYWIIYNSKTNITLINRSIIVNFQSWIDCIQLKQLQKNFLNNRTYFFERNKIEKNLRILLRSLLDQDKIQIVEVSNSNVSLIDRVLLGRHQAVMDYSGGFVGYNLVLVDPTESCLKWKRIQYSSILPKQASHLIVCQKFQK